MWYVAGILVLVVVVGIFWRIHADIAPAQTVEAFFMNGNLDPAVTCEKVFPVTRTVPATKAVGRAALNELLKGPTEAERTGGYSSTIPFGVHVQSLTIQNGMARVDFDETLERAVGGACRVTAIRQQITETLKQFPTVQSVAISIDGRTDDILQP